MNSSRLSALPSLVASNLSHTHHGCKICGASAAYLDATDFNKCAAGHPFGLSGIEVRWYYCDACGFLFTPFFDSWTTEDFAQFIYNADYSLIDPDYLERRPAQTAEMLAGRLPDCRDLHLLDYGGGNGMTARRLNDHGFSRVDVYDPFAAPTRPSGTFDIITCFEVLEHTPDPHGTMADIRSLLASEGCVILGESLQPPDIKNLRASWWYCAPRNGHCSTYADQTLYQLAQRHGLAYHKSINIHCLRVGESARMIDIANRFGPIFTS